MVSTRLLALVGFEGALGLVPDPGVSAGVAAATAIGLYALALACFAGFFLRRRS